MDYQKIYDDICKRGQTRSLTGYKEAHHIVMKSKGGSNHPSNITYLTAREHFIVHWLLARLYPTDYKIQAAFKMMADVRTSKRYVPSSRAVAEAREQAAKLDSQRKLGKKLPRAQVEKMIKTNTGRITSEDTKNRISKSLTGRVRVEFRGRIHINDGYKSKMIPPELLQEYINLGYSKGRLPVKDSTRKLKSQQTSNRRWVNNGVHNKYPNRVYINTYLENGYVLGKLVISKK